jgi:hypothetical protein
MIVLNTVTVTALVYILKLETRLEQYSLIAGILPVALFFLSREREDFLFRQKKKNAGKNPSKL